LHKKSFYMINVKQFILKPFRITFAALN